jgi:hypothetical protein
MIFCNILIILHTLSFIIVLSSKEWFKDKCICRSAFNASVFIFFQSCWVESCTKIVCKYSSVMIKRWFNLWCRLIRILHLHVMNCIFSLLKTKSIIVNWLWASQVIVSDFSNNFSLMFVMMFNRVSIIIWWVKHFRFS